MLCRITPSLNLKASSLHIPPSKSQTMRALIFALMARGTSRITNALKSPDTEHMIKAISALGATVTKQGGILVVEGTGGTIKQASTTIDSGNSGLVYRFITALSALSSKPFHITGDHSIRFNRPITPLLGALTELGVQTHQGESGIVTTQGPMQPGSAHIKTKDSQPLSALLIAASFLSGATDIYLSDSGEHPWIELTLSWLDKLGIKYEREGYSHFKLYGAASYPGFDYTVPGDFSTAAFPLTLGLIAQTPITLTGLDLDDKQGDKAFIPLLKKMGARIKEKQREVTLDISTDVTGCDIDLDQMIDALPILAVLGCFAKEKTLLYNASIARQKESDRICAISRELRKMGANVTEHDDGLLIKPSPLHGAQMSACKDHRIAMSLTIAALYAQGESVIDGVEVIEKSYPTFFTHLKKLGAKVECFKMECVR